MESKSHPKSSLTAEIVVVLLFASVLTLIARAVHPTWDDGWLMLIAEEGGPIFESMLDRPLVGFAWQWLADHSLIWSIGSIVHWLAWGGTGLVTLFLWKFLFPELPRYGVLAACLAMAPLLTTIQLVLVTNTSTGQIGSVLPYISFLMIAAFIPGAFSAPSRGRYPVLLAAFLLLVFSSILTEYTVPAGLACTVLLLLSRHGTGVSRRARFFTAGSFLAVVAMGYFLYWALIPASTRLEVRPEVVLASRGTLYSLKVATARILSGLWQGTAGYLLAAAGKIDIDRGIAYALPVIPGALAALIAHHAIGERASRNASESGSSGLSGSRELSLFLALTAGIIPIALMRDLSIPNRFWVPLLPITSCISLRLLVSLLSVRFRRWIPATLGFLIAYSTAIFAYESVTDHNLVQGWGAALEEKVSPTGITVAVLVTDDRQEQSGSSGYSGVSFRGDDYWLTAVLASTWSSGKRSRFWAFHSLGEAEEHISGLDWNLNAQSPRISRRIRGLERTGRVSKIIWVRVQANGSLDTKSVTTQMPLPARSSIGEKATSR